MIAEPAPLLLPGEERRRQDLIQAKIERARRFCLLYGSELSTAERSEMLGADLLMCKHDPAYFINSWGMVVNEDADEPDLREVPFILWPGQEEAVAWLLERLAQRQTALVPKGRKLGWTWLVLWLRLWAWQFRGTSTLLLSRKEGLVDKRYDATSLFEKLRFGIGKLPPHLWPNGRARFIDTHNLLFNLHNKGRFSGESTNPDAGASGRVEVAVLDEFSRVTPVEKQEQVWKAVESVALSRWVLYNPKGKANKSYQLYENLSEEQVFKLDWTFDPYRDEAWKAAQIYPLGAMTPAEFEEVYNASHEYAGGFRIWTFQRERLGYTEASEAWAPRAKAARRAWDAPGGWDFGSGYSLLVCLFGLVDWTDDPANFHIWIDRERVWQQEAWYRAAAEVREDLRVYGGHKVHYGDPAGEARESDQTSWITKLRGAGVPLYALPAAVNLEDVSEWGRKHIQLLINQGRLHVNLELCPVLVESMANWRLDVPEGVTDLSFLNRRFIRPRHDEHSHACKALEYLIAGVLSNARRRIAARANATKRRRAEEPLEGEGSVGVWQGLYRGAIFGDDD